MNTSLAGYLKIVTPHLSPELVTTQAKQQIQALAQHLPISSATLIECRLSDSHADVDLHASFTHFPPTLLNHFLLNPAWQACQTFGHAWMTPASALHQSIRNLILEFDLPEQSAEDSIAAISPSPYIMFKSGRTVELPELIEQVLPLFQKSPDPSLATQLNHCLNSIPEGAELANIGIWLARPHQAVRLTIKDIRLEQISAYLENIGWQDPSQTFASFAATLSPLAEAFALAIDIDSTVHPRIGLECFATAQFHDPARWQQFIDHLVQTDLCTPAKRNALLAWSGFTRRSDCPDLWPANLTYGDLLMGLNAVSLFWRRINHIKVVYQPGQPLSAKAYLAFGHSWVNVDNVVFAETS
ncbi:hypothetical protein [Vacuolonema iberomarrocanum]|uniref:hypothetical protein n=1 Tax=Vacuolonema iberomarrocanum TaxID=3454632 RepID=UPI0019E50076|nr:hypothetical protein [filamentous cyanobacterium LEGE 07170]